MARTLEGAAFLVSAASEQHEDGKARLLLTADMWHYIIYTLVLDSAEANLAMDGRGHYPTNLAGSWAEGPIRARRLNGDYALRLFDYEDFNAQHSKHQHGAFLVEH